MERGSLADKVIKSGETKRRSDKVRLPHQDRADHRATRAGGHLRTGERRSAVRYQRGRLIQLL